MATKQDQAKSRSTNGREQLMNSPTIKRLIDAAASGADIGHYGQLTLAIVGRYFMSDDDLIALLSESAGTDETKAAGLIHQVKQAGYNPPRRETLAQWSAEQDFDLIDPEDPDSGNLYRELTFPDQVYEDIRHYHEDKAS